jgi:hypothetical protein
MTFKDAKDIGTECGLEFPAEWVNNIRIHAQNLFVDDEIPRELEELTVDAKANGVRFSEACGDAIMEGASEKDLCYVCRKFREAKS